MAHPCTHTCWFVHNLESSRFKLLQSSACSGGANRDVSWNKCIFCLLEDPPPFSRLTLSSFSPVAFAGSEFNPDIYSFWYNNAIVVVTTKGSGLDSEYLVSQGTGDSCKWFMCRLIEPQHHWEYGRESVSTKDTFPSPQFACLCVMFHTEQNSVCPSRLMGLGFNLTYSMFSRLDRRLRGPNQHSQLMG